MARHTCLQCFLIFFSMQVFHEKLQAGKYSMRLLQTAGIFDSFVPHAFLPELYSRHGSGCRPGNCGYVKFVLGEKHLWKASFQVGYGNKAEMKTHKKTYPTVE